MSFPEATVAYLLDVRNAVKFTHPDLNTDALNRRRQEARSKALDTAAAQLRPRVGAARSAYEKAREIAGKAVLSDVSMEALTARKFAWERVEKLIGAGRYLQDVIAQADETTAKAIMEWAPSWLRAQETSSTQFGNPLRVQEPDTAWVTDAVLDRLCEVVAEAEEYSSLAMAREEFAIADAYEAVLVDLERGSDRPSMFTMRALFASDPEGASAVQAAVLPTGS